LTFLIDLVKLNLMKKVFIFCCILSLPIFCTRSFASTREQVINQDLNRIESISASKAVDNANRPVWDIKLEQYLAEENPNQETAPPQNEKEQNTPDAENQPERDRAIERDLSTAGLYISGAYEMNYMHYSEWQDHDKQDEDFGSQDGFYCALGYRSPNYYDLILCKPYIEGYYRQYGNMIHYKGALIGGGAYNADQRSKIQQFGMKIGGYKDFAKPGEVYGYLDIGDRVWNRGQDQAPDYHEKYYWLYIGGGVGINHRFFSRLSTGMEAEIMGAYKPKMHANNTEITFNLRNVWGAELSLPIKYYLLKNLSLDITPYYIYWHIGASVPVDGWYEPESKTNLRGLLAGITYVF